MRPIEDCSRAFIDALRDPKRGRPFDVCDESTWLDGAIVASQGQGNPQGSRLTVAPAVRQRVDACLRQWRTLVAADAVGYHRFEQVTADSFDAMQSLVETLDPDCLLLFGRVQKLHNTWLKYQIALYYSGYQSAFTAANGAIGGLLQYAHVPIDATVLDYLHDRGLAPAHVTNCGAVRLDWKLKLQKPRYMTLQDHLRRAALAAGYASPLHFEMDAIWVS